MKSILLTEYGGGLTNMKIKLVYAKIICDHLDRKLIIKDFKPISRAFGQQDYTIMKYFDLTKFGECISFDSDFLACHKYTFKGGWGSPHNVDKIVKDIKTKYNDFESIELCGDLILNKPTYLNNYIKYFSYAMIPKNIIKKMYIHVCVHLRIETDWHHVPYNKVSLNDLFKAIHMKWTPHAMYCLCDLSRCSLKRKNEFENLISKYNLINLNHNSICHELNAEADYQIGINSQIYVTTTRHSTFSNLIAIQKDENSFIYEKNKLHVFTVPSIYR